MDKPRSIEEVAAPTRGVISLNVLEGLKKFQEADEPDFVTELIDLFLEDTAVQLESLKVAVSKNDVTEVRRLAHLVKGSSGNIGALGLAELCQEIEKKDLGTFAHDSDGQTLLLKLEEEFRQVSEAFKAQRQESSRQ
ncbi:MAG TPA: Hpt domain-containing protein [Pyrinomonadaceae bacterium]|nr:Hpt domain-containing protein [Pyrinomonadaceae bacterium]